MSRLVLFFAIVSSLSAAISRDTSNTYLGALNSPTTLSYTTGGCTNRVMLVALTSADQPSTIGVTVTYNGASLTEIKEIAPSPFYFDKYNSVWGIVSPSTGANNLVISYTGGSSTEFYNLPQSIASYCGAAQTGFPDNSMGQGESPLSGSTYTGTLSTVAANCWIFLSAHGNNIDTLTAGTGSHLLQSGSSSYGSFGIFDTNAAVSAGSNSMSVGGWNSDYMSAVMVSIAPVTASKKCTLTLLGAGPCD